MQLIQKALTFDDVLLVPAHSSVLPRDVSLTTQLTRTISLHIPLASAAMDTVTEAQLAIAIAQEGGIGILHKNMSIEQQAAQVAKVKRFESGVVKDPVTIPPNMTVREVLDVIRTHNISGLPVVQGKKVVGIVTNRDLRFESNLDQPVKHIMTPKKKLVTVGENTTREEVMNLLHKHRLERLLVINDAFELLGLITVKDFTKMAEHPLACKDDQGQLRVGAAIGVGEGSDARTDALVKAGVDVIVVDTAHGHSQSVLTRIEWVKKNYPDLQVIGGNVATATAARALVEHGADGVKVGIGPGSICTTRVVAGVGVPQITAIHDVSEALKGTGISVIADGGIRYSGDIAKAIAAGLIWSCSGACWRVLRNHPVKSNCIKAAHTKAIAVWDRFQPCRKVPGDRYFQEKEQKSNDKLVPEGVEGRVPFKGSVAGVIHQLMGGVRSSMGYLGCTTIPQMHENAEFVEITAAGVRESHVHDVQITKEAPNYHIK